MKEPASSAEATSPPEEAPAGGRSLPRALLSILVLAGLFAAGGYGAHRVTRSSHYRARFGSPPERVAAVRAIARDDAPRKTVLRRVAAAVKDPAPEVRRAAVAALEDLYAREEALTVAWLAEHDPDPGVREKACRFCGSFGDDGSVGYLTAALCDTVPAVRVEAATGLAGLGVKNRHAEVAALVNDPDERVRLAAVRALAHIGTDEEVPLLVTKLAQETCVERSIILETLVCITGVNQGLSADRWWKWLAEREIPGAGEGSLQPAAPRQWQSTPRGPK